MSPTAARKGGAIGGFGSCMEARGITDAELTEGCRRAGMEELTGGTRQTDLVPGFGAPPRPPCRVLGRLVQLNQRGTSRLHAFVHAPSGSSSILVTDGTAAGTRGKTKRG